MGKAQIPPKLHRRRIVFVCREKCTCLSSEDDMNAVAVPVNELYTSQEEAEARIMNLKHASEENNNKTIIVRPPDTYVFILLLTYVQEFIIEERSVMFDTGVGNKRRLIRVQDIIQKRGAEQAKALLGLLAFTVCDTTSAFVRQGKIKQIKLIVQNADFIPVFCRMGSDIVM